MFLLSFCLSYIWIKSHFPEYCHFAAIPVDFDYFFFVKACIIMVIVFNE